MINFNLFIECASFSSGLIGIAYGYKYINGLIYLKNIIRTRIPYDVNEGVLRYRICTGNDATSKNTFKNKYAYGRRQYGKFIIEYKVDSLIKLSHLIYGRNDLKSIGWFCVSLLLFHF